MRKAKVVFPVLLMFLLAVDIVITVVKQQEVSVLSFVCVALIALIQTGVGLLNEYYDWKNRKQ